MKDIRKLNIAPTVGLLGLLKNMRYTEWHALAEFVDNSVQSYLKNKTILQKNNPNYKLKIKISLMPSEIEIRDNAAGINEERYEAAFETGKPPPDTKGLSEFGVGMKIAACWFADKWSVQTKAIGEKFWKLVEFDIKKIQEKLINELEVSTSSAPESQGYTIVRLNRLNHKPKGHAISKIKEQLASMYRHMIGRDEIEIFIDNKKLTYEMPEIRKSGYFQDWRDGIIKKPKKYKWYKYFTFDFRGEPVAGFVALRKKGSTKQDGFSLFRRNRLIINSFKPSEIFGQSNDRRQQVIFGEIYLNQMPVAFSKNDFIWNDNERSNFISELKNVIEFFDKEKKISIIKQAKEWSENLERDDIRAKSKEALGEVAILIQKGFDQSSSEKIKFILPTTKHKPAEESDKFIQKINFEGKNWSVVVHNEYDKELDYVYDLEISGKKDEELKIFINFTHPFLARYFDGNTSGLSALIAYFAISEIQVWKFDGIREVSLLRQRFNSICKNLPPRT